MQEDRGDDGGRVASHLVNLVAHHRAAGGIDRRGRRLERDASPTPPPPTRIRPRLSTTTLTAATYAPASNDMTKPVTLQIMNATSLVRSYDSGLDTDGSQ